MPIGETDVGPALETSRRPEADSGVFTLSQRLDRIVDAAADLLRVDSVGLLLLDRGDRQRAAGFSDRPAAELDAAQSRLGEGPALTCMQHDGTVTVADLAQEPAYPRLWEAVASTGVRAVLSAPVRVEGHVVGNLNLARHTPHPWSDEEVRAAEAYAKVLAVSLGPASRSVRLPERIERLRSVWDEA